MSEFRVPVVRVAEVIPHPNADRLSIIRLEGLGFTCISANLEGGSARYNVGDLCVYIPSAAVLPEWLLKQMGFWNDAEGKGTLAGSDGNRVKPMRLRGVFSEGILVPVKQAVHVVGRQVNRPFVVEGPTTPEGDATQFIVAVGDDASSFLGITKWEPTIPAHMTGEVANMMGHTVRYDFERIENCMDMFMPGEHVIALEKAHGTCMQVRYVPGLNHAEMFGESGDILVCSKGRAAAGLAFKNNSENYHTLYVQVLHDLLMKGLEARLKSLVNHLTDSMGMQIEPDQPVTIMMEVYGRGVQDLHYGTLKPEVGVFDIQVGAGWLPHVDLFGKACAWLQLPALPEVYSGPFDLATLAQVRDGKSVVGGDHIREGVVIRCAHEVPHAHHGRRICKMISPDYLTRKGSKHSDVTEYQ
jgi:RNA ligase (TIGR02306 family)